MQAATTPGGRSFRRRIFGYRRSDVDAYVTQATASFDELRAEVERLRTAEPLTHVADEVAAMLKAFAHTVSSMKEEVERECREARQAADAHATTTREDADRMAQEVLDRARVAADDLVARARAEADDLMRRAHEEVYSLATEHVAAQRALDEAAERVNSALGAVGRLAFLSAYAPVPPASPLPSFSSHTSNGPPAYGPPPTGPVVPGPHPVWMDPTGPAPAPATAPGSGDAGESGAAGDAGDGGESRESRESGEGDEPVGPVVEPGGPRGPGRTDAMATGSGGRPAPRPQLPPSRPESQRAPSSPTVQPPFGPPAPEASPAHVPPPVGSPAASPQRVGPYSAEVDETATPDRPRLRPATRTDAQEVLVAPWTHGGRGQSPSIGETA